jgi:hypothetical protein
VTENSDNELFDPDTESDKENVPEAAGQTSTVDKPSQDNSQPAEKPKPRSGPTYFEYLEKYIAAEEKQF